MWNTLESLTIFVSQPRSLNSCMLYYCDIDVYITAVNTVSPPVLWVDAAVSHTVDGIVSPEEHPEKPDLSQSALCDANNLPSLLVHPTSFLVHIYV